MSFRIQVIAAVASALLAAGLMAAYAASVRSEASAQREGALRRYGGETARVCVTTHEVARGETYTERNVDVVDWLVDLLPEGALTDEGQVIGRVASCAVAANTPLSGVCVDDQADALDVPAGKSAVSVPCSAESAVGGALTPGSVVDVYRVSEGTARLVCSSASVLATNATGVGSSLSWVTLAVDPEIVEALVGASSLQKLYFVLPGEDAPHGDVGRVDAKGREAAQPSVGAPGENAEADGGAAAGEPDAVAEELAGQSTQDPADVHAPSTGGEEVAPIVIALDGEPAAVPDAPGESATAGAEG